MATWGDSNAANASNNVAFQALRLMGGTFPASNGVLNSVSLYLSGSGGAPRIAVYQGGALDDPIGATLVEDLGQLTVNGAAGFYTINSTTNPTLTASAVTWIAAKFNNTTATLWWSTSSSDSGDFQTARGRADITGATGTNVPTTAFPSTLNGTDTFSNAWYPWYLDYSVGPTITVQPSAQTIVLTNDTTASFSVTATGTGTLSYDWELETSVGGGVYSNLADGSGATWTGQTASSCTGTFTAKTLSGRRVRCNVTDDNGTTTSTAVALTIFDGPQLTTFPATNGSGVSTATLTCDYVTGVGEAIEVRIPLSDGDVAVTVTTT